MSKKCLGLALNCCMLFIFCHNLGHLTHAHIQGSVTPCTRCTLGVFDGCLEGSGLSSCPPEVDFTTWSGTHRLWVVAVIPPQVVKLASGDKVNGDDSARVEASLNLWVAPLLWHISCFSEEIGASSGKGPWGGNLFLLFNSFITRLSWRKWGLPWLKTQISSHLEKYLSEVHNQLLGGSQEVGGKYLDFKADSIKRMAFGCKHSAVP